ncbi:MAG: molybdate ABC transporter permease subunit [Hyphomicrobium sp.]|nr:molybdate ABC transporter permease subunit [Hyphomicrobium sp.]
MLDLTPDEWEALALSIKVAFWATVASLPLAVLVSYALARWRFPGRSALDALVHLPLVLPPVVTGYLLLLTFGRQGPVGQFLESWFGIVVSFRWTGAALAAAIMSFPLMVRAIRLSIEAVDRRYEHAGATLGANPIMVFLLITLPLALPGLLAGSVLGFAKALGEFGATITFVSAIPGETRTVPATIYGYLQTPGGEDAALRLSIIAVAISMAALLASELISRRLPSRSGT